MIDMSYGVLQHKELCSGLQEFRQRFLWSSYNFSPRAILSSLISRHDGKLGADFEQMVNARFSEIQMRLRAAGIDEFLSSAIKADSYARQVGELLSEVSIAAQDRITIYSGALSRLDSVGDLKLTVLRSLNNTILTIQHIRGLMAIQHPDELYRIDESDHILSQQIKRYQE